MAYGDDNEVRTFLAARTVGIRVQVTALQLVEEDVEQWVPLNAGTEAKMAYAPKIKGTKERETPLYDQRMGTMTEAQSAAMLKALVKAANGIP